MAKGESSADLAVGWIEAWIRMDMDWLRTRLAPDFVHVSPRNVPGRRRADGPFYDTVLIREVLSPDDQASLDGSYEP